MLRFLRTPAFAFALSHLIACDDEEPEPAPDGRDSADAASPGKGPTTDPSDASGALDACSSTRCGSAGDDASSAYGDGGQDADASIADAQAEAPLPDAAAALPASDAATAPTPGLGVLTTSGQTCLGQSEPDITCPLQNCGPAHYSYTNLHIENADVICLGGDNACPEPLSDPNDPFYMNSRVDRSYQVFVEGPPEVMLTIAVSVDIEVAQTAQDAQKTITLARLDIPLMLANGGWDDPDHASGTTTVEILSYANRTLHVRAHDAAHRLRGNQEPDLSVCGFIENSCLVDHCYWADADHGGSGQPATVDAELVFTIPPAQNVKWP